MMCWSSVLASAILDVHMVHVLSERNGLHQQYTCGSAAAVWLQRIHMQPIDSIDWASILFG